MIISQRKPTSKRSFTNIIPSSSHKKGDRYICSTCFETLQWVEKKGFYICCRCGEETYLGQTTMHDSDFGPIDQPRRGNVSPFIQQTEKSRIYQNSLKKKRTAGIKPTNPEDKQLLEALGAGAVLIDEKEF